MRNLKYIILSGLIALVLLSCKKQESAKNILILGVHTEAFDTIKSQLNQHNLNVTEFTNAKANSSNLAVQQGYLLTGQHPLYSGAFDNKMPINSDRSMVLSSLLKESGYTTYFIGEWYLQAQLEKRFFDVVERDFGELNTEESNFIFYYQPQNKKITGLDKLLSGVKEDCFVVLVSLANEASNHDSKVVLASSSPLLEAQKSEVLISEMNLMPTVLALQGIEVPKNIAKRNLSRILLSNKEDAIKSVPLFYHGKDGYWGAATSNESYIQFADSTLGTISNSTNPSSLDELKELTHVWMNYFGDEHFGYDSLVKVMPVDEWLSQTEPYVTPLDELKKLHSKTIMSFHGNLKYD